MSKPRGGLAFGGAGSGRSNFNSMKVSGSDGDGGRPGKGFKGRRKLNGNFIRNAKASAMDSSALLEKEAEQDRLDAKCGFPLYKDGPPKLGWLINYNACSAEDKDSGHVVSAVACYFTCQTGEMFKCKLPFQPYFYLQVKGDRELEVEAYLRRKFEGQIKSMAIVHREDLSLKNHLGGHQRKLLKVSFGHVQQLMDVRAELLPVVQKNKATAARADAYSVLAALAATRDGEATVVDAMAAVEDIREYDVPYHVRFAIDRDVRSGHWYAAAATEGHVALTPRPDLIFRAEPRVCAFDIETTKLPLHFPNSEHDQVFMISYMLDRQGYLIVNRKVVGGDIDGFEYTPKAEFPGPFEVFNEPDERATLARWFRHMGEVKPSVYVTYNGDFFDWPFIEARAKHHGMDMHAEIGFRITRSGECLSRSAVHMDCLAWVNRDSYLPQGSRGLKAVTKVKLGYDPVEVDPEDMVPLAQTQPQAMASYSVSDAVATYYLYMTYIHPFIFSLATIIPMPPDDVLRKGSGTLCEQLLMVEAFRSNVVCPNKHLDADDRLYRGKLLATETYIGGKVEAIESGVFRSDLPCAFKLSPEAFQGLIDRLDKDLTYVLEVECKVKREDVENYDEVRDKIAAALATLRDDPLRTEVPLIYHLDVAAMYPNIILTNRLQPSAIVTDAECAACTYNSLDKQCLRPMEWVWRGESYMINQSEYNLLRSQLEIEKFPGATEDAPPRLGKDLPVDERKAKLTERIKAYAQRVYKRVTSKPVTDTRVAGVCQRENGFYIDTVRSFRDRRYEYKGLVKRWKGSLGQATAEDNKAAVVEAGDMVVLYDSLQLAHKCILNSFYGYVMRKGARWYSMEMAGVTTYTGAKIIERACGLIDGVGRPLELDTDGIWCCLPGSFPEEFKFVAKGGKAHKISYPGLMLNVMCAEHNANDQYHELVTRPDGSAAYEVSSRMSIEFEVDGPYLAMVLPASQEEGKLIKKRYAVFNFDGSLAELKGFEIKRRGELKLIKVFQSEVFDHFLRGGTLAECYDAVASVANRWLDLIDTRGIDLKDSELIEYFSESSMMSKSLEEYGDRKSCAVTTAKRLAQFLGDERIKDKGLACNYVVATKPLGTPTSARAIPIIIFSAEPAVARGFLRRWTGEAAAGAAADAPDVRDFIDWDYYRERLGSAIRKIITIPAAYQNVPNPVPRVEHPDWLLKRVAAASDKHRQQRLTSMFQPAKRGAEKGAGKQQGGGSDVDIEDMDMLANASAAAARQGAKRRKTATLYRLDSDDENDPSNDPNSVPGARTSGDAELDPNALEDTDVDMDAGEEEDPDRQGGAHVRGAAAPTAAAASGPKMADDYKAWLAARKAAWRAHRLANRQRRAAGGAGAGPHSEADAGGGLGALGQGMQRQMAAMMHATWQVLQVAPTSQPGVFDVWALIDTAMHRIAVRVPRTLYVDVDFEHSDLLAGARLVERTLPDGSQPAALLELSLSERDFLSTAPDIARTLESPAVRGCYESRLPLQLLAALHLGCSARVADRHLLEPPRGGWPLSSLAFHTAATASYLSGGGACGLGLLRYVGVFATAPPTTAFGRAATRGAFVTLLPAAKQVSIAVVQRDGAAARELFIVVAEELWEQVQGELAAEAVPLLEGLAEFSVSVHYFKDAANAHAQISADLAAFRAHHRGPVVALVEASQGARELRAGVPALRELPCCEVPAHDCSATFDSQAWQIDVPHDALARCLQWHAWLQERARVARYCGVPLCNLQGDALASAADVTFARTLHTGSHLLWCEDGRAPDVVPARQRRDGGLDAAPDPVVIDNPGCYRCVCVELRIHLLLLNAILQAPQLAECEGTVLEQSRGGRTLALLRSMLLGWASDAASKSIPVADSLLRRLHAWLASPDTALHSPQLLAAVNTAMTKTFLQLLAEVRALDAVIIAASPTSLVLATRKHSLPAAAAYVSFLVNTLASRELFKWALLQPGRAWLTLLWRDRFNHAGIAAPGGDDALAVAAATALGGGEAEAPTYAAQWSLRDFLPPAMHKYFDDVVQRFVTRPWQAVSEAAQNEAAGTQAVAQDRDIEARTLEHLRGWLPSRLLDRLFQMTQAISRHVLPGAAAPEAQFPQLPGTHLTPQERGTPALAFVRTVCYVLALDSAVEDEVAGMRRQLLALLHVREFSREAEWHDPCRTIVLRDVVCAACGTVADVDVCREAASAASGDVWRCRGCAEPFDRDAIEQRLLQRVARAVADFQLQDLTCVRCRAVSAGGMRTQCEQCGESLQLTVTAADLGRQLAVLRSVARFHGLPLLEESAARHLPEDGEGAS